MRIVILVTVLAASTVAAQKAPKIDSIFIVLPKPKAQAMDLVVEAFSLSRMTVTDNAGSLVTADAGSTDDNIFRIRYTRIVRAILIGKDSSTSVMITGEAVRHDMTENRDFKRLRIDNKAGGNGEKVWCRMVLAALKLDSLQVSDDTRKPGKCEERWKEK